MDHKKAVEEAFTELAPRYEKVVDSELRLIWGWTYKEFVDQLIELTKIEDHDLILDIATGTCVIPLRLSKTPNNGFHFVGLDITPTMLQHASRNIAENNQQEKIRLTCASAMNIPFSNDTFDLITCGLATHHMDVTQLIAEMMRVLKPNGRITVADVGAAPVWHFPPYKIVLQFIVFCYFLPKEGWARAWAESRAISNMYTMQEWETALENAGFIQIEVKEMKSKHFWAPSPIALSACKANLAEGNPCDKAI
ncbi:MAG: class I SAM-dependent methyltransferase [Smithella sp.]|nr:class I SAM-dependent methyltransferase [Chloroflexota bacterium]